MTIDIEKLIADIDEDGSGEIEYDEFRNLLSSSDWIFNLFINLASKFQKFYIHINNPHFNLKNRNFNLKFFLFD